MEQHRHDRIEFMYVIYGNCNIGINNDNISLKKNEFILIDANVPHSLIVSDIKPCRMLNLELVFRRSESFFPSLSEIAESIASLTQFIDSRIPFIVLKDTENIYPVIRNIITEYEEKLDGFDILTHQLINELFIRTARLFLQDKTQVAPQSIYVNTAIRFLYQNYDRDFHISEIASSINIHPSYLQRIFKHTTGKTITEYTRGIRIEKAKMFLIHSSMTISEIAVQTGFDDPKYFSTCFRKSTGMTPSDFKSKSKDWLE